MEKYDKVQYMPSIDLLEVQQIKGEENWMTLIVVYLKDGRLLEDKDEARKLKIKAAKYVLIDEVLYKQGFSQPYLRCLASDKSNYLLREVHEGACENHSGARALVHKVIIQATIGQLFKQMLRLMSRCVTNANTSTTSLDNRRSISP